MKEELPGGAGWDAHPISHNCPSDSPVVRNVGNEDGRQKPRMGGVTACQRQATDETAEPREPSTVAEVGQNPKPRRGYRRGWLGSIWGDRCQTSRMDSGDRGGDLLSTSRLTI